MNTKKAKIRGRCFCSQIQFELEPPTNPSGHCHCDSCKRSHGAAFVTWTSVPLGRFRFTAGIDLVRWYTSSQWIQWGFCSHCGSSMFYRALKEGHPETPRLDHMYVTVASLDEGFDEEPRIHVSWEERATWLHINDKLPKHRGKTSERIE